MDILPSSVDVFCREGSVIVDFYLTFRSNNDVLVNEVMGAFVDTLNGSSLGIYGIDMNSINYTGKYKM